MHPIHKHEERLNKYTEYACDVNMILTYYKCLDDWLDEKKLGRYLYASMLRKKNNKIALEYPKKVLKVTENLEKIHELEKSGEAALDELAGAFGEILGELFAPKEDEWEEALKIIGFFLGKYIYILDAYDDIEKDIKKKSFNPFVIKTPDNPNYKDEGFDDRVKDILTMMMAECSREFERLPIVEDAEILRNILYAGVWNKYYGTRCKRCQDCDKM